VDDTGGVPARLTWRHEGSHPMGLLIKNARSDAKRGQLFAPDMEALIKRTLAAIVTGPDGKIMKASIMDENPGVPALSVNDRYPDSVPLSTMPPEVLAALPRLEEDIEYRLMILSD